MKNAELVPKKTSNEQPKRVSGSKLMAGAAIMLTGAVCYLTGQDVERDRQNGCSVEVIQSTTNPLQFIAAPIANKIAELSYDTYSGESCETLR